MLKILNVGVQEFLYKTKGKKIIVWGAGKASNIYFQTIFSENVEIPYIVDNNKKIWGTDYIFGDKRYPIISPTQFYELVNNDRNYVLFIAPIHFAGEIIEQLNSVGQLDGIETYMGILLRDYYKK